MEARHIGEQIHKQSRQTKPDGANQGKDSEFQTFVVECRSVEHPNLGEQIINCDADYER